MTFIAPTGYSPTAMGHSPRSGQDATFDTPVKMDDNAVAGPSGSGQGQDSLGPSIVNGATRNYADEIADSRRQSEEDMYVPNSVLSLSHPSRHECLSFPFPFLLAPAPSCWIPTNIPGPSRLHQHHPIHPLSPSRIHLNSYTPTTPVEDPLHH